MDEAAIEKIALDLRKEALEKGYAITMPTIGMSMFPSLKTKDEIIIKSVALDKLRCGDVILFQSNQDSNKLIAHRLIKRVKSNDGLALITKGDFLLHCDKPIQPDTVIGKVIKIKKPYFSIYLEGPLGRAINLSLLFISLTGVSGLGLRVLIKIKEFFINKD